MDKKMDPIMLRISQEFYHIDRVLESCETIEQLQNVNSWIERILNNWEFLFKGMSDWKYERRYKDVIVSIVSTLDEKIASMIKTFQEKYEQDELSKEQRYKKPVVIKGFAQ